jgi:hypothetical protein
LRNLHTWRDVGPGAPKPPLYGLYKVDDFRMNGTVVPALLDDASRWRYVAIEAKDLLYVKHMDDSLTKYTLHYDASTHTATIKTPDAPVNSTADEMAEPVKSSGTLVATEDAAGKLKLAGTVDGQALDVDLEKVDPQKFLLNSRGFHWISETSFFK